MASQGSTASERVQRAAFITSSSQPEPTQSGSSIVKCVRCPYRGPQNSFPAKASSIGYLQSCHTCTELNNNRSLNNKRKKESETDSTQSAPKRVYRNAGVSTASVRDAPPTPCVQFVETLASMESITSWGCCSRWMFKITKSSHGSLKGNLVKEVVREIWQLTGYRFV
jgi:hypothetical protein